MTAWAQPPDAGVGELPKGENCINHEEHEEHEDEKRLFWFSFVFFVPFLVKET